MFSSSRASAIAESTSRTTKSAPASRRDVICSLSDLCGRTPRMRPGAFLTKSLTLPASPPSIITASAPFLAASSALFASFALRRTMHKTVGEAAAAAARAAKPRGAGAVRPARRMASESLLTGSLSQAQMACGRGGWDARFEVRGQR